MRRWLALALAFNTSSLKVLHPLNEIFDLFYIISPKMVILNGKSKKTIVSE